LVARRTEVRPTGGVVAHAAWVVPGARRCAPERVTTAAGVVIHVGLAAEQPRDSDDVLALHSDAAGR